jgi:hypothetical protein
MSTVIDSLLVTLGLDSSGFKTGMQQASSSLQTVGSTADETAETLGGLALRFGGIVAAAIGIGDVVGHMVTLGKSMLPLQMMADVLGLDAKGLLVLGETSQQFGGHIEDAAASVDTLQQSLFNLKFKGEMSDQLIMLQRLGVQFMDSDGKMRDFKDIMVDASRAAQSAGMDKATAYQYAMSIGLSGGLATAFAEGPQAFLSQYGAVSKANKSVSDPMIAALAKTTQSLQLLRDRVDANIISLDARATPAINKLSTDVDDLLTWLRQKFAAADTDLNKADAWLTAHGESTKTPFGLLTSPLTSSGSLSVGQSTAGSLGSTILGWLQEALAGAGGAGAPGSGVMAVGGSTDIGTINIYTQATDAKGIAAELPAAIKRRSYGAQATSGVTQ